MSDTAHRGSLHVRRRRSRRGISERRVGELHIERWLRRHWDPLERNGVPPDEPFRPYRADAGSASRRAVQLCFRVARMIQDAIATEAMRSEIEAMWDGIVQQGPPRRPARAIQFNVPRQIVVESAEAI